MNLRRGGWNRRALAVTSLAVLAAILAIAAGAIWLAPRSDGPIRFDGTAGVKLPVAVGQPFAWAMPLPPNPTSRDISIRSVDPVGTRGLEILGVVMAIGCDLPTTALEFPPEGVDTFPVDEAVLPANQDPCLTPTAIIGGRRTQAEIAGTIDGLRLRYVSDGTTYEVVLALKLEAPNP